MVALIVETPYQMINGLNLIKNDCKECVLFIKFVEEKSKRLARDLNVNGIKEDFIKDVYIFDGKSYVLPGIGKRILYKIRYGRKNVIKFYIPNMNLKYKFNEVLASRSETSFNIFSPLYTDDVKVSFIEDGIGDYLYSDFLDEGSEYPNSIKSIEKKLGSRYLVTPQLFKKRARVPIEKLPLLKKETMPKTLFQCFPCGEEKVHFNRFVYFAQMFDALPIQTECPRIEKEIYDTVRDVLEESDLTVKLHPRSEANVYGSNAVITNTPWEIIALVDEDIDNKVLISMCSGSVFYSKLLCDKEPYVICVMKLYLPYIYTDSEKDIAEKERTMEFIHGVKNSYKNKEKFMIPENVEELREMLKNTKQGRV
ncbi:MAG: hypothetical protein E7384_01555 [Ruminococcaceae bacterium]|nr:hypothetical protein [Oscillospiraceae bacterium]